MKMMLGWVLVLFALHGPALASEEEELGIVMKNKSADSAQEAARKAGELAGKYERAKQHAASAFGLAEPPAPLEKPEKVKAAAAAAEKPSRPFSPPGTETLHLTNGQVIPNARVVRREDGGMWVEMEGMEVFFSDAEIKSVESA